MLALFDVPSLDRALSLPLDRKLRELLSKRVTHLQESEFDLEEITYFLCIGAGISEADVLDEIGMVPTISDNARFGDDAFVPWHDCLFDRGGWFEVMFSAGNDAVYILLIQDDEAVDPTLLEYCRQYAF